MTLAAVCAALILLFAKDWSAMAGQWWNSSTYTHVLLVPAIIAWLVWQRWPQLQHLRPSGWWPGLALLGGALLFWVLGAFSGLDLARQLGATGVLAAATLTLLGPKVGAALAFPLFYMLFLVPMGDELIAPLQLITAEITVGLVRLTHIPAVIDGVFINTPAGLFEVAEACSGVKFLIAMIAFGALVCGVCFSSWPRRAAFMALAVVLPILANGVRAWGTIFIAQYKGAEAATGIDHVIYGWFFFALVISLLIAIGWRFFDRAPDAVPVDAGVLEASPLLTRLEMLRISRGAGLGMIAAMAVTAQGWAFAADRLSAPLPGQIFLPEVPGWHRVDFAPATPWQPRATGANHRLLGSYADGKGHKVDVFYALYSGQTDGREAGGFGQGALTPDTPWSWLAPGPQVADAHTDRLLSRSGTERLAETRYRTGALLTGSNMRLKLANTADRLLLRDRATMLLILSAEKHGGTEPEQSIAAFRHSAAPLDAWMDRIGGVR
ncbi:MAG: exosortase A [Novosphingobium sp.]